MVPVVEINQHHAGGVGVHLHQLHRPQVRQADAAVGTDDDAGGGPVHALHPGRGDNGERRPRLSDLLTGTNEGYVGIGQAVQGRCSTGDQGPVGKMAGQRQAVLDVLDEHEDAMSSSPSQALGFGREVTVEPTNVTI